jgi:DNA repair exonuclease SbcCD nuclease subunit
VSVLILHTADWQLGKAFGTLGDEARVRLRDVRFEAVARIGALARDRRADAVLVAGDVFDSSTAADSTLRRALVAMESFCGPWVLLPGNHDPLAAEGVWARLGRLGLPDSVIIAGRPEPLTLAGGRLVVLPAPLSRNNETADLTAWFNAFPAAPGAVRVGLAHGSIPSRLPAGAEARNPIAEDRATRSGLDYLALGDWHGTLRIDARTWYSGTPEPDRAKDNDPGNVLMVRIAGPGATPEVEPVTLGYYRWHDLKWPVHSAGDIAVLKERLRGLEAPLDRHVVRLFLEGVIDLGSRAALENELRDLEARLCDLRVDHTRLLANPSEQDLLQCMGQGGFVGAAVARLREAVEGADADAAAVARLALQILYLERTHSRAGC